MAEIDRKFSFQDSDLVSCSAPCDKEFAREVPASKSLPAEYKGKPTLRCVASMAALRGSHHARLPVTFNDAACRVCTIYNSSAVDNVQTQG